MTDKEALKLALDALERNDYLGYQANQKAITALKERLEYPMREVQRLGQEIEQEPVAHKDWCASLTQLLLTHPPKPALCNCTPPASQRTEQEPVIDKSAAIRIATALGWEPKREWVGLTDEEIMEMLNYGQYGRVPQYARNFVDAIEAKLKEKNCL